MQPGQRVQAPLNVSAPVPRPPLDRRPPHGSCTFAIRQGQHGNSELQNTTVNQPQEAFTLISEMKRASPGWLWFGSNSRAGRRGLLAQITKTMVAEKRIKPPSGHSIVQADDGVPRADAVPRHPVGFGRDTTIKNSTTQV